MDDAVTTTGDELTPREQIVTQIVLGLCLLEMIGWIYL